MSELRKLLAEATPGPWDNTGLDGKHPAPYVNGLDEGVASTETIPDAALIVYLRNHAEDIAALIEAAQTVEVAGQGLAPMDGDVFYRLQDLRAALAPFGDEG